VERVADEASKEETALSGSFNVADISLLKNDQYLQADAINWCYLFKIIND